MTTIDKKVDIPENRRLTLDLNLPSDLPVGEADVKVIITPARKRAGEKPFAGLAGILKDSVLVGRDAVELQREMRDEW